MSAPRKITTARRIGSGRRDILTAETTMSMGYVDAIPYHHDDVVRELAILIGDMKQRLDYCGDLFQDQVLDGREAACRNLVARADVALAKIAQEG